MAVKLQLQQFHPEGKGADTHARKIATASVAMKSCAPGPVETNSYKIQLKAASPTYQYVLHIFFLYIIHNKYVHLQIKLI